ncbi:MAG: hypothetical protein WEB00_06995 [Dehalococcoidia bacterium]
MHTRVLALLLAPLLLLAAACNLAAAREAPDNSVVRWAVLEYNGSGQPQSLDEFIQASVPHNGGVADQIGFVLEHQQGWQRAGIDFQAVRLDPSQPPEEQVDMFIFVSDEGNFPCAMHSGDGTYVAGCSIGGVFPGNVPCILVLPNSQRRVITVVHEVGHCLGLGHTAGGVMAPVFSGTISWPSEDEIAQARENLGK